jgi:hypothetical protein
VQVAHDELRGGNNTGGASNRDEQRKPGEKEDRGSEGNTDRPEEKITRNEQTERRRRRGIQNRRRENRTNNTRIPGDKYRERTGDPRK